MKGFLNEFNPVRGDDVVLTPDWVAKEVVKRFQPKGKILDPCSGEGAFLKYMPKAEWCEIRKGRDFFEWKTKMDWIVSNPPYSIFRPFLLHSFTLAPDIVFLIPVIKVFNSIKTMLDIQQWGGVRTCLVVGLGKDLSFPQSGYPIAALHFQKDFKGGMTIEFVKRIGPSSYSE